MPRLTLGKVLKQALQAPRPRRNRGTKSARSGTRRSRIVRAGPSSGAWGRALPAAYASHVKPSFRIISKAQNSVRVAGCDLVQSLPPSISKISGSDNLFTIISSNPAYWMGTRVAQIAPAYMNYRPIRMTLNYIPQVAVTQAGTVIMGTLWNGASPASDIQQTLLTSNGGRMINCYVPATTRIALGANLPQNLFTLNGSLEPDTQPFIFVAIARGCTNSEGTVVPGYFFVEYEYEFKNPIGAAWLYQRSDIMKFSEFSNPMLNSSIILMEQNSTLGPGTIIDVETVNGKVSTQYRGSDVSINPDTIIQAYQNQQTDTAQEMYNTLTTTFNIDGIEVVQVSSTGNELRQVFPFSQFVKMTKDVSGTHYYFQYSGEKNEEGVPLIYVSISVGQVPYAEGRYISPDFSVMTNPEVFYVNFCAINNGVVSRVFFSSDGDPDVFVPWVNADTSALPDVPSDGDGEDDSGETNDGTVIPDAPDGFISVTSAISAGIFWKFLGALNNEDFENLSDQYFRMRYTNENLNNWNVYSTSAVAKSINYFNGSTTFDGGTAAVPIMLQVAFLDDHESGKNSRRIGFMAMVGIQQILKTNFESAIAQYLESVAFSNDCDWKPVLYMVNTTAAQRDVQLQYFAVYNSQGTPFKSQKFNATSVPNDTLATAAIALGGTNFVYVDMDIFTKTVAANALESNKANFQYPYEKPE